MVAILCAYCQKRIDIRADRIQRTKRICCSVKCMGLLNRAVLNIICDFCGSPFHKKASDIVKAKKHFCSQSCRTASMRKEAQETLLNRFWTNIDKNGPIHPTQPDLGPCWLWTARCFNTGYGAFTIEGKQRRAHIVAYELTYGPIPKGRYGLHSCDRPACCNPYGHVYPGTPLKNMQDKHARQRQKYLRGEECPHAILTEEIVRRIYQLRGTAPSPQIANQFSISPQAVLDIWWKRRWKHILSQLD